jgi:hypothetical protein
MKKQLLYAGLAAAALLGAGCSDRIAKAAPQSAPTSYEVQPGDNAWNLSGQRLGDPTLWKQIVKDNPILQEKGRVYTRNGITYVLLHPGERLQGLERLGITQVPAAPPAPTADTAPAPSQSIHVPPWAWILGVVIVGGIAYFLFRRSLHADPTRRNPQVPGGVTAETARERLVNRGVREHFTILELTPGRASGLVTVSYAGGRTWPRILDNEPAFRARVRFQDGHEEERFMLQRCGNDLRAGASYAFGPDFGFVPNPVEEAAPAPPPEPVAAAAPEPVAEPVPESPAPVREQEEDTMPDGMVRFSFKRAAADQPQHLVRLQGVDADEVFFEINGRTTTLRYTEVDKRRKRPAPAAPTPALEPA